MAIDLAKYTKSLHNREDYCASQSQKGHSRKPSLNQHRRAVLAIERCALIAVVGSNMISLF
jgi:hypothetical protein